MRQLKIYTLNQLIKEPILVLAFLLVNFSPFTMANDAQAKIDSLIALSKTNVSDSTKLFCYLDVSYYYQPLDTIKMWEYYQKTVDLATKVNIPFYVASSQMDIGNWYSYTGNIDKAEEWYLKAINSCRKYGDINTELLNWLNIADLEVTRTNYDRHIQIVDSCLEVSIVLNLPDVEMPCYGLYGLNYWRLGEYDKAMEYSLKSLKMAEEMGWNNKVIQLYNNIGLIYKDSEEYEKALVYLKKSMETDYFIDPETYHHIGRIYMKQGKDSLAQVYLDSARSTSVMRDNVDLQSGVLNSLSELEMKWGNYSEALTYLLKAKKIISTTNQKEYLGRVYVNLSEVYRLLLDNDSAIYYANLSVQRSIEFDEKETLSLAYLKWSEALQAKGDFENAFIYNEKYSEVKNEILNEKRLKNISVAEIKYETAKKDLEIERSQQNLKTLQLEKQELQIKMVLGLVTVVLVFGALFAFLKVNSTKKEQQQQEEFTKHIIQSQEEERKKISGDLHDSIGQNLLLIKRNEEVLNNPELNELVSETLEEVRSISRDLHPVQLERLGFTNAIELIIDKCENASDIVFSDELENIDGLLSKDQELNLYRVIQESLNNILKHSQAKSAKLQIENLSSGIRITIQDNGVGFDYSKKIRLGKTIGLTSLSERAKYLNGRLDIKTGIGKGTSFIFVIPHNQ